MIKILKIFFVSLILIFFVSLTYLSIFGIETNRFNKLISDKIRNIHPEIDVKLKKIKLTIELFELKVLIVTKNPVIEISNKKLNLKKVSTAYNIKSFFKKDFGITNLNFTTDYNEVKNIIKFARAFKDSPQLLIIDKVSKSGKLNINARLKINEKGVNFWVNSKIYNHVENTHQFLLGGDCEVADAEILTSASYRKSYSYSSVGVSDIPVDTFSGTVPQGTRVAYIQNSFGGDYNLQLMNKEKIITIPYNNMRSNQLFGTSIGGIKGTGGLSTRMTGSAAGQIHLGAEFPFKLFSKASVQRTAKWFEASNGTWSVPDNTRSERELWNSDNIFGYDLSVYHQEIPVFYESLYSWSPASSWWQLQMPTLVENDQYDNSFAPPTLKIDLTEYFTQSAILGSGDNRSDGKRKITGIKLNKIWVNFGMWGTPPQTNSPFSGGAVAANLDPKRYFVPGFPTKDRLATDEVDQLSVNQFLNDTMNVGQAINHMCFNLILELPTNDMFEEDLLFSPRCQIRIQNLPIDLY